ncbi:hypothetical protein E2562_030898 [Oryza meyeriana var. granulata]|uniref:Uncharacterized protein n=1 Tax=Oryza meyeriana var. granulata TaxID=110450 RepID=A0A6G1F020_9ORYZ|nr:hypothetical protein E2562_030898 [Oryza meyeriana var. granulata]
MISEYTDNVESWETPDLASVGGADADAAEAGGGKSDDARDQRRRSSSPLPSPACTAASWRHTSTSSRRHLLRRAASPAANLPPPVALDSMHHNLDASHVGICPPRRQLRRGVGLPRW